MKFQLLLLVLPAALAAAIPAPRGSPPTKRSPLMIAKVPDTDIVIGSRIKRSPLMIAKVPDTDIVIGSKTKRSPLMIAKVPDTKIVIGS